ncbi:hypothetical protein EN904_07315 [Mesorhizobium sp. M7A.F.Ca.CA.001.07.2.1]|nr:hypothetical protein EN983_09635 [Mesorhizobium sp. M7A.F.Ca.CA.004.08.2.1]RUX87969.1 hypothetical protein EN982_08520 [Mesorhizobium sp. M7A.F.Ca.CA.004.08.1.1]RUY03623.1 hypothetical protein EN985_15805 [Mesorhizobium sp. M7A.F.Ca.CA.004.04.1.1]RUY21941.1 hypothetical protein EN984_20395 [Mesorhizobium sp. M7A.F.Ca.CA.004.12.1.1]RUY58197.1 hypothetical protein EN973_03520 [Mesorhizobium sp. M7A.F.Ca.CA.001.12.1.1]RUY84914.1 hypothetical protein EN964_23450 [Mesorhizobium sp. M7A.F.Ca.CA.0
MMPKSVKRFSDDIMLLFDLEGTCRLKQKSRQVWRLFGSCCCNLQIERNPPAASELLKYQYVAVRLIMRFI